MHPEEFFSEEFIASLKRSITVWTALLVLALIVGLVIGFIMIGALL